MEFTKLNQPKNFYVYIYTSKKGSIYYVGKGKGIRAWVQHRDLSKGCLVWTPKDNGQIKILAHNLTEDESYILEKKLILDFGRKDLGYGPLLNKTNGGDGATGRAMTAKNLEVQRQNSRPGVPRPYASRPGELNYFYGKSHTDERIKYFSEVKMADKNPMFGKTQNRVSCLFCKKETSVNAMYHHKKCG
jgi:hypothetical protein